MPMHSESKSSPEPQYGTGSMVLCQSLVSTTAYFGMWDSPVFNSGSSRLYRKVAFDNYSMNWGLPAAGRKPLSRLLAHRLIRNGSVPRAARHTGLGRDSMRRHRNSRRNLASLPAL